MTVLGSIAEGTPLGTLARAESLPCCSLVAAMVLEQVGHHPDPATLDAYADADPVYWPPANVWSRDAPWSALTAARSLLRGRWAYESLVGEREGAEYVYAPKLTRNRWHIVQRWRGLDLGEGVGSQDDEVIDGATGHTYWAHMDAAGSVTIVQSSTSLGLRVTEGGSWVGTAGLDGYSVGVLTLPAGVL
jgi:hypothetical protein